LEARAVTVTDGFYFDNVTRPAEGLDPVLDYPERAIKEHGGPPVFTVTKSSPQPSIRANLTSDDNLYWFKGQSFDEIKNKVVNIHKSDQHYAQVNVWNDALHETGNINMMFLLSIRLPAQEFDRLIKNLWVANAPCRLRLEQHIVCLQEQVEADLNPVGFPNNYVFEVGPAIPVMFEGIYIEQSTIAPASITRIPSDDDEEFDPLAANRQLQALVQKIEKRLLWLLVFVAAIAVSVILLH
jgi:hypothetical protein